MGNELTENNTLIFYDDEEGNINIEVVYANEDVWLSQKTMAELFDTTSDNIGLHLRNIYKEQELNENSTAEKISVVQKEGNRDVKRTIIFYNLDAIIAVGYRVNSRKATKFRTWANKIIKDYMVQGWVLNEKRFMEGKKGDLEYFQRLLEKIKLIRTSERMFYQKITDIFAECSIDYSSNSDIAREFFANVQNKFHYAITGKTASELIYERIDSSKENMGLTSWKESPDGKILKSDVTIAKNCLEENELEQLNNLVNIFLDVAEDNAKRNIAMTMEQWKEEVERTIEFRRYNKLVGHGKISKENAEKKAHGEYEKYKKIQDKNYISDFDKKVMELDKKLNN
ncbi:MAG: virulence RhuM family protein [Oscillospiraceae bacterium]|nr:virulence RhuM family protein [Oscillospiraceae bacterium]